MLRRTYEWMMRLAGSPDAPAWLALLAFAEGVFFPVPPDVLLMPLVLASRERAWRYALICLSASVLGGSVGFALGYFLQPLARDVIALTGGDFDQISRMAHDWGVALLVLPIPYKLIAIALGVLHTNFALFFGASIVIRGLRFFLVAGLLRAYGPPIREFIEKRLALVVSAVALGLIGLVVAIRFAF